VRHLREYLSILVPMCRGEKVDVRASTLGGTGALTIRDAKPVQVIVAALGEQTMRVSAELADGTFTWCVGPHTLADHTIPTMTKAAQNAGRPAPRIVAGIPVCVTNDAQAAHDRAARSFAVYATLPSYRAMLDREGASILADIAIIGDEDEVAKRIRGLADLGVTDYAASEFGGREDRVRTRELLKSLV
jgi:F420-dependent oxidoreductase-like protein